MNTLKQKQGSASALIILVLTLLVLLGVLSLVTSAADRRLAQKRVSWQNEYYLLDKQAVEAQAKLANLLEELYQKELENFVINEQLADNIAGRLQVEDLQDIQAIYEDNIISISFSVGKQDTEASTQVLDLEFWLSLDHDHKPSLDTKKWLQGQSPRPVTEETGIIWIPDRS